MQYFFGVWVVIYRFHLVGQLTMLKVPSGKGENRFAYNGEYKDRKLAMDVIRSCWLTPLFFIDLFCFASVACLLFMCVTCYFGI